jgi:SAM-dependent methyltransferase
MIAGGVRQVAGLFGVNLYRYLDDRRVLEQRILPYFAERDEYARILFAGCAWFTDHYEQIAEGKEYWTLDFKPAQRQFGAARHICGPMADISAHVAPDSLDVIFCNGLLGWGLDEKRQIELAFNACVDCLRPGGVFVLGWNDVALRRPCLPEDCGSLQRMQPFEFPPLRAARHRCRGASRHTYDFYVK